MSSGAVTAKVRQRGLDGTGVTEDVARALFAEVGSGKARIAVVEIEPVRQINEATGDHKVECTLGFVEVAEPGSRADDVLRELARALYRDRRVAEGEMVEGTENGGVAQTADVATQAEAAIERGDDGKASGTWDGDVDGTTNTHQPAPEEGEAPAAPGPGADDASFDKDPGIKHKFLAGSNDPSKCAVAGCGKGDRAKVHQPEADA